jgi:hypothetical protein
MMAVKQLAHFFNPSLFGFEASLGDAKAVEHAWASGPDTGGPGALPHRPFDMR